MMTLLLAMISFSFVMSITPGPVNMIILSSGINYGVKRTMPYVTGATIGFTLLLLLIGFGLSQFIATHPELLGYLAFAGSLYIIYLGYKIASSKPNLEVNKNDNPRFYEGFILQWINPKAWIACVSGATIFSSAENDRTFIIFAITYLIVCFISLSIWAIVGDKLSSLLRTNVRLRLFNLAMGLLLMITAGYLCYGQFKY